ncbi:hypothetical protein AOQ84DRAFT_336399 [Glonium stellatum]|uniref:Rhodopsin domain-containing protein n=1 Tax=Glonium stellatum TaxID=574774 RepID=A0A8E2F623_9PEZI|nr:hypothetical protein AOQ84DRAFT_336399 [Glonium stellatum]
MAETTEIPVSEHVHHAADVFVGVTTPLLALSFATLTARLVLRLRSGSPIGWDDGLIIVGSLLAAVDWALQLTAIALCTLSSRSFTTIAVMRQAIILGIATAVVWSFAVACIKISVACLLLRFQHRVALKVFLYVLIGVLALSAASYSLFVLLLCRPLAAAWNPSIPQAKCVGANTFSIVSIISSSIHIITDVILSLFPVTFLYMLRRPTLEKVCISILMGMGLTASAASIIKVILVTKWVHATDSLSLGYSISTWTCVEMFLGITAACLPSLKSTLQRSLAYFGIGFRDPQSFAQSIYEISPSTEIPLGPMSGTSIKATQQRFIGTTSSTDSTTTNRYQGPENGGKELGQNSSEMDRPHAV